MKTTTDTSHPETAKPDRSEHAPLFGPPPLFEGEDPNTYNQFLSEISTAVMPADILEEILVRDHVDLTFEVLRLRRLKTNLIMANAFKGLIETLAPLVDRSRAETLAEGWAAHKSDVVEEVDKLLTSASLSMDNILAQTFSLMLNQVERIERMIAVAEMRRNAALREIDRHHQALGQKVRRSAQQLEDDQFRLIESSPASIDGVNVK